MSNWETTSLAFPTPTSPRFGASVNYWLGLLMLPGIDRFPHSVILDALRPHSTNVARHGCLLLFYDSDFAVR